MLQMDDIKLTDSQTRAWKLLQEGKSLILFGAGATGKTFLQNLWKKHNPKCDIRYIAEAPIDWEKVMLVLYPEQMPVYGKFKKSITIHLTEEERKVLRESIPQRLYVTDDKYSDKWHRYIHDNVLIPVILE